MRTAVFLAALLTAAVAVAKINVVTTTPDLASIASAVGGDRVKVTSIVKGSRDLHRIEAKPSYMSLVASAHLFIAVGLDLEVGYERPILEGSGNRKVRIGGPGHLYAHEHCLILEVQHGRVSRAQGDIHPHGNPHIWLDPWNGRQIAWNIRLALERVDPAGGKTYDANARAFIARIDQAMFGKTLWERIGSDNLWEWQSKGTLESELRSRNMLADIGGWYAKMAPVRGGAIVTYHRSWTYFTNRFQIRVATELEPRPGIDPTPAHLANVIKTIKAQNIKVIVQEPFYSKNEANFVASKTGANVLVLPSSVGQESGVNDYLGLIDVIVNRLSTAVK